MKLIELLSSVAETPREEWAEDLIDQITNAHNEDMSVPGAKIESLTNDLNLSKSEIDQLKTQLYDLTNEAAPVDEDETVDEDVNEPVDIEDFFTYDDN